MDLNEIRSFVVVVEKGSFTRAAEVIQIPKSTLSRHLINLEKRLGVTLVQRSTRRVSLTPFGKQFYQTCSESLRLLQQAEKNLSESHELPKGKIKFTAPIEVGNYFLSEAISEFSQKYPEIEFDILFTDRIVDLVKEEFDLALRAGKIHDDSLVSKKIGSDVFVLVASQEYLKNSDPITTPEDLLRHRCWIFSQMSKGFEWKLSNGKQTKLIKLQSRLLNNSMQSLKSIIAAGGGIALLPLILARDALLVGELNQVLSDWKMEGGAVHLCYPKQKKTPERVKLFANFLMEDLKKNFKF